MYTVVVTYPGNTLEKALRKIGRDDIVNQCIYNVELVTDDVEKAVAKVHLDQSGFDNLKEELGPSRDTSLRRNISLDATYDEQDMMRVSGDIIKACYKQPTTINTVVSN
jgi:ankyrin